MLCAALCLAFTALAGDKMKLDLKITNDPKESMFYFNGTGTGTLDYEGRQLTAEIDLGELSLGHGEAIQSFNPRLYAALYEGETFQNTSADLSATGAAA